MEGKQAGILLTASQTKLQIAHEIITYEQILRDIKRGCHLCREGNNGVCNMKSNIRCQHREEQKIEAYISRLQEQKKSMEGRPDLQIYWVENPGLCQKIYMVTEEHDKDVFTIRYENHNDKYGWHSVTIVIDTVYNAQEINNVTNYDLGSKVGKKHKPVYVSMMLELSDPNIELTTPINEYDKCIIEAVESLAVTNTVITPQSIYRFMYGVSGDARKRGSKDRIKPI